MMMRILVLVLALVSLLLLLTTKEYNNGVEASPSPPLSYSRSIPELSQLAGGGGSGGTTTAPDTSSIWNTTPPRCGGGGRYQQQQEQQHQQQDDDRHEEEEEVTSSFPSSSVRSNDVEDLLQSPTTPDLLVSQLYDNDNDNDELLEENEQCGRSDTCGPRRGGGGGDLILGTRTPSSSSSSSAGYHSLNQERGVLVVDSSATAQQLVALQTTTRSPPRPARRAKNRKYFRLAMSMAFMNIIINSLRPDDWISYPMRIPRIVWEFVIILVAGNASKALTLLNPGTTNSNITRSSRPKSTMPLFLAIMTGLTGLTDIFIWAPVYSFSISFETCGGGWFTGRPYACREDYMKGYSRLLASIQAIIGGLIYLYTSLDAWGLANTNTNGGSRSSSSCSSSATDFPDQ